MNEPVTDVDATVLLKELTLTDDGDKVIVGDPQVGRFVAVPPVGAVVIRALRDGATIGQAKVQAETLVGETVDVTAFVATLGRLGFVADSDVVEHRTAAIHLTGWRAGPRAALVRPFFGRTAWTVYALAFAFTLVILATVPQVRPTAGDAFIIDDVGLSLLVFLLLSTATTAFHECWHWLAAVAAGVPARFGVDRRWYFIVFETDLSQIWRLPRRARYGPVLAGLAADSVLMAGVVMVELGELAGWWRLPTTVASLAASLLFAKVASVTWQAMLFLRTDLYAVLQIATGCRNLWRVKTLLLRRAFGRLDESGRAELNRANPRDVAVGRWFRWVWLGGFGVALAWFGAFYLPFLMVIVRWAGDGLALGPARPAFWYHLGVFVGVFWPHAALCYAAIRDRVRRRATVGGRAAQ